MFKINLNRMTDHHKNMMTIHFFNTLEQITNYICKVAFGRSYYSFSFEEKKKFVDFIRREKNNNNLKIFPACYFLDCSIIAIAYEMYRIDDCNIYPEEYISIIDDVIRIAEEGIGVSREILDM